MAYSIRHIRCTTAIAIADSVKPTRVIPDNLQRITDDSLTRVTAVT